MGFYNVARGDAPYLTQLAREYTLNDNYHQPVMGGTFANQMVFGYADALYYADANGDPATPNHVLVPVRTRRFMSMRSRTPIRRRAPTTGTPMTAMAAAATPTALTSRSRASPRSSTI
jgi:Phospholipase C